MPEERELEKQLKLVSKTGKYVVGRREVMSGLKGTKLLVWSTSANLPQALLDDSKNLSIPAVRFSGNPVELGRACGIPFRVSVFAVKSTGDADLKQFANSADYSTTITAMLPGIASTTSQAEEAEVEDAPAGVDAKAAVKGKKKASAKKTSEKAAATKEKKGPAVRKKKKEAGEEKEEAEKEAPASTTIKKKKEASEAKAKSSKPKSKKKKGSEDEEGTDS